MAPQSSRLRGNLGLVSVVLFGIAYMAPVVVVTFFGIVAATSSGASPTAYSIATGAMLLTGLSYARMARVHLTSGSVYTYARTQLDSRIGFLAGWAMLLDYLFLPMVAWLLEAVYLHAQFPVVPQWLWMVITVGLTTAINVVGITTAERINRALLLGVTVGLAALLVLCVHYGVGHGGAATAGQAFWNHTTSFSSITAAAAIAAYAFLGFDAVSTLTEESRDPQRTIPRGIILTVLAGGAIFILLSFALQWAHPGGSFPDPSSAGYLLATTVGGRGFADVFNIVVVLSGLASGVAIQAGTSRLMFVMGRDGVLPRKVFGFLHGRFHTPVPNIVIVGGVGFLGAGISLDQAASFVNFGAFLGFTLVNVCVIAHAARQWRAKVRPSIFGALLLPAAGAGIDVYLLTQLGVPALKVGVAWLVIGIVYLAVITKGFRAPAPDLDGSTAGPSSSEVAAAATTTRP